MPTYDLGRQGGYVPPPAVVSGVATVQYQLRDANGNAAGAILTGVQVSATRIQPQGFPATPAVTIGTGAGQATAITQAPSQNSQILSGNGLPAVAPPNPAEDATYESLDLNAFWRWDTNDQLWRSAGQLKEILVLTSLQASTWTRMPNAAVLTSIDEWTLTRADGQPLIAIDNRRAADGWPELHSLNAYLNLQIKAFGESVINP